MSRRTERVAEELRAELALLLRREITDPRLQLVTLTRVDVSPDLARADVFWSHVGGEGRPSDAETDAAFAHASGFLRRGIARALPLRRAPELHFHHDPSLALGDRALAILREIEHGPKEE
jgi:ribosome-binding factor A